MPTTDLVADPRLIADVQAAEGYKLVAYKDSLGNWTIGTGHKLEPGHDWSGYTITPETATGLLSGDLRDAERECYELPEWPFLDTVCRQNALVEIIFNMGVGNWTRDFPKTRAALQAQSWAIAAANLLNSPLWISQVGRPRVARLAGYFQNGSYYRSSSSPLLPSPSGAEKSVARTGSTP
jgi:GH24 family phage-related lysozyme (muramidase)